MTVFEALNKVNELNFYIDFLKELKEEYVFTESKEQNIDYIINYLTTEKERIEEKLNSIHVD
ncbi:hypothetical protein ABEV41_00600 [Geobacillus thermodenitrificans]|uniref:hypothetical protein n=1 Tax=Geobacillus thermodenitrificans TaxID=33940 RepID=UPI003D1FED1A